MKRIPILFLFTTYLLINCFSIYNCNLFDIINCNPFICRLFDYMPKLSMRLIAPKPANFDNVYVPASVIASRTVPIAADTLVRPLVDIPQLPRKSSKSIIKEKRKRKQNPSSCKSSGKEKLVPRRIAPIAIATTDKNKELPDVVCVDVENEHQSLASNVPTDRNLKRKRSQDNCDAVLPDKQTSNLCRFRPILCAQPNEKNVESVVTNNASIDTNIISRFREILPKTNASNQPQQIAPLSEKITNVLRNVDSNKKESSIPGLYKKPRKSRRTDSQLKAISSTVDKSKQINVLRLISPQTSATIISPQTSTTIISPQTSTKIITPQTTAKTIVHPTFNNSISSQIVKPKTTINQFLAKTTVTQSSVNTFRVCSSVHKSNSLDPMNINPQSEKTKSITLKDSLPIIPDTIAKTTIAKQIYSDVTIEQPIVNNTFEQHSSQLVIQHSDLSSNSSVSSNFSEILCPSPVSPKLNGQKYNVMQSDPDNDRCFVLINHCEDNWPLPPQRVSDVVGEVDGEKDSVWSRMRQISAEKQLHGILKSETRFYENMLVFGDIVI